MGLTADIAAHLDTARRRTLELLGHFDDETLRRQISPLMSPLVWDFAHIGHYEELWLLRALTEAPPTDPRFDDLVFAKRRQRLVDESAKPLEKYREEELEQMKLNFYGFDPSYHVARYHFVMKSAQSWTPRHLARHRDLERRAPGASP